MLCILFTLFFTIGSSITVLPILRPNQPSPSCNAYIVYDDTQVLVIDVGKEESDADTLIEKLTPLLTNRTLNGVFITHGHPDHVMAVWKLKEVLPIPYIFVATDTIKGELINLMHIFGAYLNASSPGNPRGDAPFKFDYVEHINVLETVAQLWSDADSVSVYTSDKLAETNHYAFLELVEPAGNSYFFTGDLIYVKSHLFMGYDVSLDAQCDWIVILSEISSVFQSLPQLITMFPGHGVPIVNQSSIIPIINENIEYISFAREIYAQNCDPTVAANTISEKFTNFNELPLLVQFSAPVRVSDASLLGCNCTAVKTCTDVVPPPCY